MKCSRVVLVLPLLIWLLSGVSCNPVGSSSSPTGSADEEAGRESRSIQVAPRSQLEQSFLRFGKSHPDFDWSHPSAGKRAPEEMLDDDDDEEVESGRLGVPPSQKPPKRTKADYFRAILSRRSDLDKNFMRFGRAQGMDRNFLRFGRTFFRNEVSQKPGSRQKRSVVTTLDDWDEQEQDEEEEEPSVPSLLSETEHRHVRPFFVIDPTMVSGVSKFYSDGLWRLPPIVRGRFTSYFPLGNIYPRRTGAVTKRTWGNIDNNFIRFG